MRDELTKELVRALIVAVDSMRRCDPVWCAAMNVKQVSDMEWDLALAIAEDALEAAQERAA